MKKVIAVIGPTCTGKTKLAIDLAKEFGASIISCDSVAVYKELNIGSAKPTKEELEEAKHYLIDILEPTEKFDVATCQHLAREIIAKEDLCILCGGTGLYINAILNNYEFNSPKRDESFAKEFSSFSNQELYDLLLTKDKIQAAKLHPNNRKRVLRALEVILKDNHSLSLACDKSSPIYDSYLIYLDLDREILYNRINERVDKMFALGLEKEVRELYDREIVVDAIGYKEFIPYFNNLCSLEEVKEKIKLNTRHLAKRQKTWFKNQTKAHFYDCLDYDSLYKKVSNDLKKFMEAK